MKHFKIKFDPGQPVHKVSKNLYGIFLEDINFAVDGGLNANMVNNYSFGGVYFDRETKKSVNDFLRYWVTDNCIISSRAEGGLAQNSRYARLAVEKQGSLSNLGYNGLSSNRNECAMSIERDSRYKFSCYLRKVEFSGEVYVEVVSGNGNQLIDKKSLDLSAEWNEITVVLTGIETGYGKLVISFVGSGSIDIDCVSLMNEDYWGNNDPKWRHGKLRKDLVQSLSDLKPKFMRFPGGCIVEGQQPGNEYDWKDTVGNLYERNSKFSLWAERVEDGGYNQSYQIGFYEYFCLCEDLGAKPLPTLFAGINCQVRSKAKINLEDSYFENYVVQNYLDLIEFANGKPEKNEWAALREKMGHPAPFNLEMIGIGNENFGKDYHRRFEIIKQAIQAKYPNIKCVLSSGLVPFKLLIAGSWSLARKKYPDVLVDEHSYHTPAWFIKASKRFDKYKRGTAKVYFGEYAANSNLAGKKLNETNSNLYFSALAEAAFLTGVERNSDVVEMTSYAPLFNLVGGSQWYHNLIDFNPSCICLTMNYYVQQLFSANIGEEYLSAKGKLPKGIFAQQQQTLKIYF